MKAVELAACQNYRSQKIPITLIHPVQQCVAIESPNVRQDKDQSGKSERVPSHALPTLRIPEFHRQTCAESIPPKCVARNAEFAKMHPSRDVVIAHAAALGMQPEKL